MGAWGEKRWENLLAERVRPIWLAGVEAVVVGRHVLVHSVGEVAKAALGVVLVSDDEV